MKKEENTTKKSTKITMEIDPASEMKLIQENLRHTHTMTSGFFAETLYHSLMEMKNDSKISPSKAVELAIMEFDK